MANNIYTLNFRGWRGTNVDEAAAYFRELYGHAPTLILAREGAPLKGDTALVRRSGIPQAGALLLTDNISEWSGK